ncbi:hypothetical protein RD792_005725 [Penstemon davidsonii]|uniref:Uncharacterized protein n=1 Tax=Penstemon davidsonii TaxID=160366 RepID=A0ABR0DEF1_9LAMI|nr:hypothetical protein RD792_005725 [Penstemon davidsonii]
MKDPIPTTFVHTKETARKRITLTEHHVSFSEKVREYPQSAERPVESAKVSDERSYENKKCYERSYPYYIFEVSAPQDDESVVPSAEVPKTPAARRKRTGKARVSRYHKKKREEAEQKKQEEAELKAVLEASKSEAATKQMTKAKLATKEAEDLAKAHEASKEDAHGTRRSGGIVIGEPKEGSVVLPRPQPVKKQNKEVKRALEIVKSDLAVFAGFETELERYNSLLQSKSTFTTEIIRYNMWRNYRLNKTSEEFRAWNEATVEESLVLNWLQTNNIKQALDTDFFHDRVYEYVKLIVQKESAALRETMTNKPRRGEDLGERAVKIAVCVTLNKWVERSRYGQGSSSDLPTLLIMSTDGFDFTHITDEGPETVQSAILDSMKAMIETTMKETEEKNKELLRKSEEIASNLVQSTIQSIPQPIDPTELLKDELTTLKDEVQNMKSDIQLFNNRVQQNEDGWKKTNQVAANAMEANEEKTENLVQTFCASVDLVLQSQIQGEELLEKEEEVKVAEEAQVLEEDTYKLVEETKAAAEETEDVADVEEADLNKEEPKDAAKEDKRTTASKDSAEEQLDPYRKTVDFSRVKSDELDLNQQNVHQKSRFDQQSRSDQKVITTVINALGVINAVREGGSVKSFAHIAMDRSGSHVAETALKSLAMHLQDNESHSLIEETLTALCEAIVTDSDDIICNCYGSHVLRRILCLCKGVPIESSEFHGTKSSVVLAERFNMRSSQLNGHELQQNEPFPDQLKFLVSEMLNPLRVDIATVQANQYSSLVLQAWPFLQVILAVAPDSLYKEICTKVFKDALFKMSLHPPANFVVQALISHTRNQEQVCPVKLIFAELGTKFKNLLEMGRAGVVAALLAASQRIQIHEDKRSAGRRIVFLVGIEVDPEQRYFLKWRMRNIPHHSQCCQALADAVCLENKSSRPIVSRILFINNYFCSGDKANWNLPKDAKLNVLGSLILQTVFKFPSVCGFLTFVLTVLCPEDMILPLSAKLSELPSCNQTKKFTQPPLS